MDYYMCRGKTIIHPISSQELPLELVDVEPMAKFGYEVIALNNDDEILLPVLIDGKVEYRHVA